ncbi:inorganic phosphate transporter [Carboxylicivirga sp. A043]|uniref:inorganic phosphate transporter n=1 Tax=Carboxylicivirga litoralis TaxID=2816963 RepID=UPI0021CB4FAE|nr:inorganic phosphate transporter [Carboxylicivirga sp. A043]MCU4157338.1 inorganic phosphate transporter [Carboxylicivirga sp. A043]
MENIYLILVIVLFALAISDLIVGVSNDAVNFLNSAIGAKAAPYKYIMIVAALGILFGATFSSGMMEVARKGIFNPQYFVFSEIMIIFLAVMITDVILLDVFNTFGMPTSTTVSIVFEILGAAVAVALIKVSNNPEIALSEYINTAKALAIISGILLSVVISFSVGALVQYITRLIFSFDYDKRLNYFGAIWGGIAITAITYFILVKGAKGASFMHADTKEWIKSNGLTIIAISMVGWTVLLQILKLIFKVDILKIIVLTGTFALAMAFAGNDLVNFIGVPLAGFESFKIFAASGDAGTSMEALAGKVATPTYMLIIAGAVMVVTLWTSKKAKAVVKTSLDLSRQQEGDERFGSSYFARSLVRVSINASNAVSSVFPKSLNNAINRQFDSSNYEERRRKLGSEAPVFDMLRASVNLVVASILISIATNMKLPLSTTYVTFMVAMGSSLADRAWGRESAVYRITGVLSVIGGWFFTALSAFTVAFVMALLIATIGIWFVAVLVAIAIYVVFRTHIIHKKSTKEETEIEEFEIEEVNGEILAEKVLEKCKYSVTDILKKVSQIYAQAIHDFEAEDRRSLKEINKEVKSLNKKAKKLKGNVYPTVKKLQEQSIDSSLYYIQVVDYLREVAHCLEYVTEPAFEHIDNNHKVFSPEQFEELNGVRVDVQDFMAKAIRIITQGDYGSLEELIEQQQTVFAQMRDNRKKQLKRIKNEKAGTKVSLLYLNTLHETQNLMLHLVNLVKAQRDFVDYQSK